MGLGEGLGNSWLVLGRELGLTVLLGGVGVGVGWVGELGRVGWVHVVMCSVWGGDWRVVIGGT